jgi:hypothetical protein
MMTKGRIRRALEMQFKVSMIVILIITALSILSNVMH